MLLVVGVCLNATADEIEPAATDLLLHWKFEETGTTTNVADSSGNNNTATLSSTSLRVESGSTDRGKVLKLGSNDSVISSFSGIGAGEIFSVSFWIKPDENGFVSYSQKIGNTTGQFLFRLNGNGYLAGGAKTMFSQSDCAEPLKEQEWQHIVFTFDNSYQTDPLVKDGYARYYRNGRMIASKDSDAPDAWTAFSLQKINGYIDDVRVYNRRLTGEEIVKMYNDDDYSDTPHQIGDERYAVKRLGTYQIPEGDDEVGPYNAPGWNVLSEFGTVTKYDDDYYYVKLVCETIPNNETPTINKPEKACRPVLVQLTPSGSDYTATTKVVDTNWFVRADSHHHLALEVDKDGQLHLVGDMHNYPRGSGSQGHLPTDTPNLTNQKILYWRTSTAKKIDTIEFLGAGDKAPKGYGFTYLRFFKDNNDDLYMAGRYDILAYDSSNQGRNKKGVGLTRYDATTKKWVATGEKPITEPSCCTDDATECGAGDICNDAEVVLWEEYDVSSAANATDQTWGYTKVIPWITFGNKKDNDNTLHLSASLTDNDCGLDYSDVETDGGTEDNDTIAQYTTDIVYMRSSDKGASFKSSDGDAITLPGRLAAGSKQAEIVYDVKLPTVCSEGMTMPTNPPITHVTTPDSYVVIDHEGDPGVAFHRYRRYRPDHPTYGESNRAIYMWQQDDGSWKKYTKLGKVDKDFRYLLQGPDGDFTLVLAAQVNYFYRLWGPDEEPIKVQLPFKPYYFNPNVFRKKETNGDRELVGLAYDKSAETVSIYRVVISVDKPSS
jgi:hypothetical protein